MEQTSPTGKHVASAAATRERINDWPVSLVGIAFGLVLFACSLTPSLVPREPTMQGLIGGAVFAFGYWFAAAVHALWCWLGLPEPRAKLGRAIAAGAAALGGVVAVYALARATVWQNSVRDLMSLPPLEATHAARILLVSVPTAVALLAVGWLVHRLVRLVAVRLERVVSERLAILVAVTVAALVVSAVVNGVLVRWALTVIDASYAQLDRMMEPDTERPDDPQRTGSAASLIEWPRLGREGRRFVADTTPRAELAAFWPGAVHEPIRVYVGLGAGDDEQSRANLALAELRRLDAFDRDILLVALPTGTGFMDEAAIETLEYLTRGDVATVAQQYSYLQSPFSLIFEPEYSTEAARSLLRTIYNYWKGLPKHDRPKLYLYGLSLGALSSERSLRLHEMLGDPIQGALWVGPPFLGPIHREVTRYRAPGSPAWKPVFEDGSLVRFMNRSELAEAEAPWGPLRIIYVQHPSDPIVNFSFDMLWRRPDFLRDPRGDDVSPLMRWVPVVSALQVAGDMALSNNVPLGHGHQYARSTYLEAWTALIEPDASAAELKRLATMFDD